MRLSGAKQRLAIRGTDAIAKKLNPIFPHRQSPLAHDVDFSREAVRSILPCIDGRGDFLTGDQLEREENLVTICTGAGHPLKQIPNTVNWEVAEKLASQGKHVVLLGGENDPSKEIDRVQNLVGKTSIPETITWIRKSGVHIAADTGTGHIAAQVETPLVTVWGNMPFEKYRPYTSKVKVLNRDRAISQANSKEVIEAVMGGFPSES